jgi:hypothetical protein
VREGPAQRRLELGYEVVPTSVEVHLRRVPPRPWQLQSFFAWLDVTD